MSKVYYIQFRITQYNIKLPFYYKNNNYTNIKCPDVIIIIKFLRINSYLFT